MRGAGPVGVNGTTLYAYFTRDNGCVRLRISVDEADGLNVFAGLRVRIALPDQEAADLLITSASRTPPYVWLDLEPIGRRLWR
jgi:hypothetical protein